LSQLPPNANIISYADPTIRPQRPGRSWLKWLVIAVLVLMVCACVLLSIPRRAPSGDEIPISEFRAQLLAQHVSKVTIVGDTLYGSFGVPQPVVSSSGAIVKATRFRSELPVGTTGSWPFVEWLLDNQGPAVVSVETDSNNLWMQLVVPFIPWLLIFGFVYFMLWRFTRTQRALREAPTKVILVNQESKA
jgi:ATP-dependent Zn protease